MKKDEREVYGGKNKDPTKWNENRVQLQMTGKENTTYT